MTLILIYMTHVNPLMKLGSCLFNRLNILFGQVWNMLRVQKLLDPGHFCRSAALHLNHHSLTGYADDARYHYCSLLHYPLCQNLAFSKTNAVPMFKLSSNNGQNILQWSVWNTGEGSRTAIRGGYDSMLFAKFNDGLCSLPNIRMQLDLEIYHQIIFTCRMISTNLVH